jgi:hypothetical protein
VEEAAANLHQVDRTAVVANLRQQTGIQVAQKRKCMTTFLKMAQQITSQNLVVAGL